MMGQPISGQALNGLVAPTPADTLVRAVHALNQAVVSARAAGWSVDLELIDRTPSVFADLQNKPPQSLSATITRKV